MVAFRKLELLDRDLIGLKIFFFYRNIFFLKNLKILKLVPENDLNWHVARRRDELLYDLDSSTFGASYDLHSKDFSELYVVRRFHIVLPPYSENII